MFQNIVAKVRKDMIVVLVAGVEFCWARRVDRVCGPEGEMLGAGQLLGHCFSEVKARGSD